VLYRESCLKSRVAVPKVVLRVDFPEIGLARVVSQFLFAYWRLDNSSVPYAMDRLQALPSVQRELSVGVIDCIKCERECVH